MKRMARKGNKNIPLSLTSLMDVFTNLVFFLLLSQGVTNVDEPPKDIKLPESYVDSKPRPTVNIMVSDREIMVQGEPLAATSDVLGSKEELIPAIREKLAKIKGASIGLKDKAEDGTDEVTILAHSDIPFKVMKRLMATCTSAGYSKISLAVNQKTDVAPR
jgi:biopolymer transport protein ExbD